MTPSSLRRTTPPRLRQSFEVCRPDFTECILGIACGAGVWPHVLLHRVVACPDSDKLCAAELTFIQPQREASLTAPACHARKSARFDHLELVAFHHAARRAGDFERRIAINGHRSQLQR